LKYAILGQIGASLANRLRALRNCLRNRQFDVGGASLQRHDPSRAKKRPNVQYCRVVSRYVVFCGRTRHVSSLRAKTRQNAPSSPQVGPLRPNGRNIAPEWAIMSMPHLPQVWQVDEKEEELARKYPAKILTIPAKSPRLPARKHDTFLQMIPLCALRVECQKMGGQCEDLPFGGMSSTSKVEMLLDFLFGLD